MIADVLVDSCVIRRQAVSGTLVDAAGVPTDDGAPVDTPAACRVSWAAGSRAGTGSDGIVESTAAFFLLPDVDVAETDTIIYDGTSYRIVTIARPVGYGGAVDHVRVDCVRTTR